MMQLGGDMGDDLYNVMLEMFFPVFQLPFACLKGGWADKRATSAQGQALMPSSFCTCAGQEVGLGSQEGRFSSG